MAVDYASKEAQDAFLTLPKDDQDALVAIHEAKAHAINDIIQSAGVSSLTEALPYFKLAGYRLEKQNHGAPHCPDIALNEKEASREKPQAWSYLLDENAVSDDWRYRGFELWKRVCPWYVDMSENEARQQGLYPATFWKYNTLWSFAEAKFLFPEVIQTIRDLKKKVPETDVWMKMLKRVPGVYGLEKAKALGIPMAGRHVGDNEFWYMGDIAHLASSSPWDSGLMPVVRLARSVAPYEDDQYLSHGSLLRFFYSGAESELTKLLASSEKSV